MKIMRNGEIILAKHLFDHHTKMAKKDKNYETGLYKK